MKKLLVIAALGLMAIGLTFAADNASAQDAQAPQCACYGCATSC
jgi:hypothetical protein